MLLKPYWKKGLKRDSNPGLWDAGAMLFQLRFQPNWEQVIMWVNGKHVDIWDQINEVSFWLRMQTMLINIKIV